MGVIHLAEDLGSVVRRQVAEGRAASEAEFLAQAVQRYAQALDADHDELLAAADEGLGDLEAGRFDIISGAAGLDQLRATLDDTLNEWAAQLVGTKR